MQQAKSKRKATLKSDKQRNMKQQESNRKEPNPTRAQPHTESNNKQHKATLSKKKHQKQCVDVVVSPSKYH